MAPPAPANTEDETAEQDQGAAQEAAQPDKERPSTKRKTKSQSERDDALDKIYKLAQAEDHPVELALTAIAKQMIRTLDVDEQDELLDEIQSVSSSYFRERQKRLKRNNAQQASSSTTSVSVAAPLPPPLTPAGHPVQSGLQHAEINQTSEVLVELGSLPPMEQYNIHQYVQEPDGTTYMKFN